MPTSEFIYLIHWVVYTGSFAAFLLLFTSLRKWGAGWIAILYGSQVLFGGCLLVKWQNFYRVKEGLIPVTDTMLTDRFSENYLVQILIALVITLICVVIFLSKKDKISNI